MAQLYRVVPVMLEDRTLTLATCDPQNLAIQDELRNFLGYDIRLVVATEGDIKRALGRYYASESESIESILTELEQDDELKQAVAAAAGSSRPGRLDQRRGVGRQRPGPQAAEHGAADGHQGPRQRHPLRAVRGRVPHPHQGRRGVVRNGSAPAAFGVCHHDADQGHGELGHCRTAVAAGRAHRVVGGRSPGRSAGQRAADDVRRERGDAGPGPLGRVVGLGPRGHWTTRRWRGSASASTSPTGSSW